MTATPLRLELRHRLDSLAGEWDTLVDRQLLASPFLKSWWIEHAGAVRPTVLCVFDGRRLVGGAAFEQDRIGWGPLTMERVRSVGQGALAPDHLDIISEPGGADEVLQLVLGWLRRPGSRLVDLDGLAAAGTLGSALDRNVVDRIAAPYTTLPATGEEYLAGLPGKVRSTITRTRKRFAKEGVESRRVAAGDLAGALDVLAELHEHRWSEASNFLASWDRFRAAAAAGALVGDVIVEELVTTDGEVIAIELDLLAGGRCAFYQAGRRVDREWRGCGSVVRAALIDRACSDGIREYDLLRGDESYKAEWADARRDIVRCRLGIGTLGRAVNSAAAGWRRAAPGVAAARQRVASAVNPGSWTRRPPTQPEQSH
jgi:CelD/BcsL family acetyltransferase involved in cellulose biosynthesis